MKAHTLLTNRWSPTAFLDKEVEPEKLRLLFEAARTAPSSYNEQPWRYIVGTNKNKTWQMIFDALMDGNKKWNEHVPVLAISVAKDYFEKNGKDNRFAMHDTGQANALLTVQANVMGLHVHQMGGFYPEKIREEFNLPETMHPASAIAIGYLDKDAADKTDAELQNLDKRGRKSVDEFVFEEKWGTSLF